MKKIIMLVLAAALCLSLTACGEKSLVDKQYEAAYKNALAFVEAASKTEECAVWQGFKPDHVEVKKMTADIIDMVLCDDDKFQEIDENDLLISMVDNDKAQAIAIVCDSETNEVLGRIPMAVG